MLLVGRSRNRGTNKIKNVLTLLHIHWLGADYNYMKHFGSAVVSGMNLCSETLEPGIADRGPVLKPCLKGLV